MKYLLLSNYHHPIYLRNYINNNDKVLIITFSNYKYLLDYKHRFELWNRDTGREFNDLLREYQKFGLSERNMHVVYSTDKNDYIIECIEKADIIFLAGGDPRLFMEIVDRDNGVIKKALVNKSDGIIIGASAGAMSMCSEYYLFPCPYENTEIFEYRDGMGMVDELILVHYDDCNIYMHQALEWCDKRLILIRDYESILINKK